MYQVLMVEDDQDIIDVVKFFLDEQKQYNLISVTEPLDALKIIEDYVFDIVLLDIMLPGLDGIDLCIQLRKKMFCPIIFISCLDDDDTIIKALKMGGDDYLTKPFKGPMLLARMEANLRRITNNIGSSHEYIKHGDLVIIPKTHTVKKDGKDIYLSPTEYELLYYMVNHIGEILEMEKLFNYIWHRPSFGDVRTISVHISNLRKKIESNPNEPAYIKTVRKIGYMFSDAP